MNHSFNVELATKLGVTEAIIIENFAHWLKVNSAKKSNYRDGMCWTWNTTDSLAEIFPYISRATINRKINLLVEKKILKTEKSYNKLGYDNTLWYTIIDPEILKMYGLDKIHHIVIEPSISAISQNEICNKPSISAISQNEIPISQNEMTIPYINSDINKNKKYHDKELDVFENLFKKFDGINFTKTNQASVKKLLKTMSEKNVIDYLVETYEELKKAKGIKSIARAFSVKIQKGERQVNSKPKVEKTNDPIISTEEKEKKQVVPKVEAVEEETMSELELIRIAVMKKMSKDLKANQKTVFRMKLAGLKTTEEIKEFAKNNNIEI
ncbi:MAG: hypothetical protein ACRCYT_09450 [Cetobacterium sp.]